MVEGCLVHSNDWKSNRQFRFENLISYTSRANYSRSNRPTSAHKGHNEPQPGMDAVNGRIIWPGI